MPSDITLNDVCKYFHTPVVHPDRLALRPYFILTQTPIDLQELSTSGTLSPIVVISAWTC